MTIRINTGGKRRSRRPRIRVVTGKPTLRQEVAQIKTKLNTSLKRNKKRQDFIVKVFDNDINFSVAANALTCVSQLAVGDGDTFRDGGQVHIYKIHVKGYVEKFAANSPVAWARVMLLRAKNANGQTVSSADILEGDLSYNLIDRTRCDLGKSYTILKDMNIMLLGSNMAALNPNARQFEFTYFPPKSEITTYSSDTAATASNQLNHYFVLLQQSRSAPTSDVKGYCTVGTYFNP